MAKNSCFLADFFLNGIGGYPPPLNGKSSCPKTLNGIGGYPPPLTDKIRLNVFDSVPNNGVKSTAETELFEIFFNMMRMYIIKDNDDDDEE